MRDFMDESRENSLAYMVKKGKELTESFNRFYKDMNTLQESFRHFADQKVEKLKEISQIASSIQDIAKNIRMLSLNVSIEAANLGETRAGFHVLARDLWDFANKTMNFSQDVKARIAKTISGIGQL